MPIFTYRLSLYAQIFFFNVGLQDKILNWLPIATYSCQFRDIIFIHAVEFATVTAMSLGSSKTKSFMEHVNDRTEGLFAFLHCCQYSISKKFNVRHFSLTFSYRPSQNRYQCKKTTYFFEYFVAAVSQGLGFSVVYA